MLPLTLASLISRLQPAEPGATPRAGPESGAPDAGPAASFASVLGQAAEDRDPAAVRAGGAASPAAAETPAAETAPDDGVAEAEAEPALASAEAELAVAARAAPEATRDPTAQGGAPRPDADPKACDPPVCAAEAVSAADAAAEPRPPEPAPGAAGDAPAPQRADDTEGPTPSASVADAEATLAPVVAPVTPHALPGRDERRSDPAVARPAQPLAVAAAAAPPAAEPAAHDAADASETARLPETPGPSRADGADPRPAPAGPAAVAPVAHGLATPAPQPDATSAAPDAHVPPTGTRETAPADPGGATVRSLPAQVTPHSVAGQIAVAVGRAEGDRIEVRLDPPELGRVEIHIAREHGGVQASVIAERAEVHDLLRRHAQVLLAELDAAGFSGATLDFATAGRDGWHDRPEARSFALEAEGAGAPAAVAAAAALAPVARLAGGLDIRL